MKFIVLFFAGLIGTHIFAQGIPPEYQRFVAIADSFYKIGNYKKSAENYSAAFKTLGWKGALNDRYNAACSWAMAGVPDSAFYNLNKLAFNGWRNYSHMSSDSDLSSLYTDKRWKVVLDKVLENKQKAEANLNQPLVKKLDSINNDDQLLRRELDEIQKKFGFDSKEVHAHWKKIMHKDSANLIKVKRILDTQGWLGPEVVGDEGSQTLFLVIQHADQVTQEKYLPMMREAVKNKKASPSSLALLEDRVALGQGKKQRYGSQIGTDPATGAYFLFPMEDPDHVDDRRTEVGLGPLSEYLSIWNLKWDVEQYKKDLPALEKKTKHQ